MRIWRKDGSKDNEKQEATKKIKLEFGNEDEEFTDISAAATAEKAQSADDNQQKKPHMEEIYSTADKQIKYKKLTPIEAEKAEKRRQLAKEELTAGKVELSAQQSDFSTPEVELKAQLEEGTVVADDIIDDVDQFRGHRVYVQDIDDIDIELDSSHALKEYEKTAKNSTRREIRNAKPGDEFERVFGKPKYSSNSEKIVALVPVYKHESKINKIRLKAGRFTDVVESEYDEYLQSDDPAISKVELLAHQRIGQSQSLLYTLSKMAQQKAEQSEEHDTEKAQPKEKNPEEQSLPDKAEPQESFKKKHKSHIRGFIAAVSRQITIRYEKSAAKSGAKSAKGVKPESPKATQDYESRQDAKYVMGEIKGNIKALVIRTVLLSLIFITLLVFAIMEKSAGANIFSADYGMRLYCALNLILLVGAGFVCAQYILGGLRVLKAFKGNADTACSVAFVGCALQGIASLFFPLEFVSGVNSLYALIVVLGLLCNVIGKLFMANRVKRNFKFIQSKSPAYAAKILSDEETAKKMISGTAASSPVIAYQHKTNFLSDFLKISYAPDPGEEVAGRLAPITIVCSVFVAVVYAFLFKTAAGAFSAFAVMSCIGIPVCAMLAGNIPLWFFSRSTLSHGAMVCGYPSVRQFSDCTGLIVDANELYPKGSIHLDGIKTFVKYRIEESILACAAVLVEANSPLKSIFEDALEDNSHSLPKVESVLYEDKLGLVGWVNGERVLVGNRELMERYSVSVSDTSLEKKYKNGNKQVTYIAQAGQLVAMTVTTYRSDPRVMAQLHHAESNGLCVLVCTTDSNITSDRIAEDYHIFYRTVRVLPTGYANVCNEAVETKEDTSRAYLATRGKFTSLCRAVSGCVRIKSNITIGLIVQIFGLVLGVLLCATMSLYASVARLGAIELMLYILFWSIASIIAELIQKP